MSAAKFIAFTGGADATGSATNQADDKAAQVTLITTRGPTLSFFKFKEFLRRVAVLPWDSAVTPQYASARAGMASQGKTLAPLDLLIASHALSMNAILVTNDQAFSQMPNLAIEDWTR